MNKTKLLMTVAAAAFMVSTTASFAAEYSFGVVDMNVVMQKASAAKSIMKQLDDKKEAYRKQIDGKEKELRAAEEKIVKEKDKLSKDEFEKKRESFKQDVIKGHKLVQKDKLILDRAFNMSMTELRKNISAVIADIAKEKNYAAVLTQNSVMMSKPELDITAEVIEKLDDKVKTIKIDWDEAAKVKEDK